MAKKPMVPRILLHNMLIWLDKHLSNLDLHRQGSHQPSDPHRNLHTLPHQTQVERPHLDKPHPRGVKPLHPTSQHHPRMPIQVDHPINKVYHLLIPHNKLLDTVDPLADPQVDPRGIQAKAEVAFMVDHPNQQGDTDHPILDMGVILEEVISNHPKELIHPLGLIKDPHPHLKVDQTTPLVVLYHLVLS